jgi:hypothetical protein
LASAAVSTLVFGLMSSQSVFSEYSHRQGSVRQEDCPSSGNCLRQPRMEERRRERGG